MSLPVQVDWSSGIDRGAGVSCGMIQALMTRDDCSHERFPGEVHEEVAQLFCIFWKFPRVLPRQTIS